MTLRRLVAVVLLSGIAVVTTATPAFAHAELIGSDPAQGAVLATPPQQVRLTFTEPVTLGATPVAVTGPGGAAWTVGAPVADGAVVTAPVRASGPAGTYSVVYEMVAPDGDTVRGAVTFTLTAAVAPPPTTTTTVPPTTVPPTTVPTTIEAPPTTTSVAPAADESPDDGGVPAWVWALGAVVVLAGVVVALRLARHKKT